MAGSWNIAPHTGAWIEIGIKPKMIYKAQSIKSHPTRVRGLK